MGFHKQVNTTVLLPKGSPNPLGVLTSDGRPCVTPPTSEPKPGKPGAPPEPNYAGSAKSVEDKPSFSVNTSEPSVISSASASAEIDKLKNSKNAVVLETKGEDAGSDKSTCLMLASKDYGEKGEGKIMTEPGDFTVTGYKVSCPKKCIELSNNGMTVFGPAEMIDEASARIYTLGSSICGAAIHAGIITNDEGGDVLIHLSKGRESFISVAQNGIKSIPTGAQEAAF